MAIEVTHDGKIFINGSHRGNIVVQNDIGPGNDLDKVVRFIKGITPHRDFVIEILQEIRNNPRIAAKIRLKAANYLIDYFKGE